ncbi:hypothetical protein LRAMOSA03678 [Lichtheimia ramosa]|uniref:Uncharacterized protein n=1 Tax=Lichtheimia ramosa TaxID=688394 RepID=A0A077WVU8_9FUNG|nr:hypothetical protein LRAMOSA03678 [Lichtheimia ramosa]
MAEKTVYQFGQAPPHYAGPTVHNSAFARRHLPIRKNACLVCSVCFTCARMYGANCICEEVQPRRGKNLPEGSLDSRAKKLHPQDKEDFEFSMKWLSEHAHPMYRDNTGVVVGLRDLAEVSLCKAHSSTLYRAKKRHERTKSQQAPPSPADSNSIDMMVDSNQDQQQPPLGGGLAAKVREISSSLHQQHQPSYRWSSPDVNLIQPSTSFKRKRTLEPHSSASTPLYASSSPPPPPPISSSSSRFPSNHQQLPPLSTTTSNYNNNHRATTPSLSSSLLMSYQSPPPMIPIFKQEQVLETVSLKSPDSRYYLRNLAITDTFTFRDLLKEIDMTTSPPPGKRIVVSDERNETFFPLDQAIRSVIRRPLSSHMELCLGLRDKPSIDWNNYV